MSQFLWDSYFADKLPIAKNVMHNRATGKEQTKGIIGLKRKVLHLIISNKDS